MFELSYYIGDGSLLEMRFFNAILSCIILGREMQTGTKDLGFHLVLQTSVSSTIKETFIIILSFLLEGKDIRPVFTPGVRFG